MSPKAEKQAVKDLKHVDQMNGDDFEDYMVKVLNHVGLYKNIKHTPYSNDHGLDAYGKTRNGKSIGFQFKNYGSSVPFHAVEETMFGMMVYGTEINVVLTNSHFSSNTIRLCKKINRSHKKFVIRLIARTGLFRLLCRYGAYQVLSTEKRTGGLSDKLHELKRDYHVDLRLENHIKQSRGNGYKVKQFADLSLKLLAPILGFYSLYDFGNPVNNEPEYITVVNGNGIHKRLKRLNMTPRISVKPNYTRLILGEDQGKETYVIFFVYYSRNSIRHRLAKYRHPDKDAIYHRTNLGYPSYPHYQYKLIPEFGYNFDLLKSKTVFKGMDSIRSIGFSQYFSPHIHKIIITNAIYQPREYQGSSHQILSKNGVPYYQESVSKTKNGTTFSSTPDDKYRSIDYTVYDINSLSVMPGKYSSYNDFKDTCTKLKKKALAQKRLTDKRRAKQQARRDRQQKIKIRIQRHKHALRVRRRQRKAKDSKRQRELKRKRQEELKRRIKLKQLKIRHYRQTQAEKKKLHSMVLIIAVVLVVILLIWSV